MLATGLAARWRPRRFSDVAGQGSAVSVLKASAESAEPVQQILLSGPSGTGKTTLGRIYAASLLCTATDETKPCGQCESCMLISEGRHPDIHELDAASNGGVDDIRQLSDIAAHSSSLGSWRVFIIDEAHGLTAHGAQAFLKLLEEPPRHVIFCLATTDPQKLPLAIRGRCLNIPVTEVSWEDGRDNVVRVAALAGWNISDDLAEVIVRGTDPALGVRGTLMTLEQVLPRLRANPNLSSTEVAALLGVADSDLIEDLVDAAIEADTHYSVLYMRTALKSATATVVAQQMTDRCLEIIRDSDDDDRCSAAAELLGVVSAGRQESSTLTANVAYFCAQGWFRSKAPAVEVDDVVAAFTAGAATCRDLPGSETQTEVGTPVPEETSDSPGSESSLTANVQGSPAVQTPPQLPATGSIKPTDVLNAVSAVDSKAALALSRCNIDVTESHLMVSGSLAGYESLVSKVCSQLGLTFNMAESS